MQRPTLALFFIAAIAAVVLAGKPVLAALLGIPAAVIVSMFRKKSLQEAP